MELQDVVRHTDQSPFAAYFVDPTQQKLPKPLPVLDLPEYRLDDHLAPSTHAQQTSHIISRFEAIVLDRKPDLVLVYGDVNSTVAAALVCAKLMVPVAHVEVGLRSFDRSMPEEVNRLLTDQLSDLLFTPSAKAYVLRGQGH